MSAKILDGRIISSEILDEAANDVERLKNEGWTSRLVSIKIGDNPAVDLYVRNQKNKAEKAGIIFIERHFPEDISLEEVKTAIAAYNVDPRITGIIIQRPVPDTLQIKDLQKAIHPLKDVEGMHPASIGNIVYNELELGPCTAIASVELLRRTELELEGLEVTVIGHSEIVGKPIAFMLMAEGATVTVCHHMTRDVAKHSKHADAVFVAVGKPSLVTADIIKPGAALIDIGINQIDGPDGKPKIVGDSDYESCSEVAGWITPVPGGVGPVTVSILMRNTVIAVERQKEHYDGQFSGHI
jgi:methylenetetrahydrofolate dehydrogenase (NADP+) / methenyltetrahydrofolate cyclohydrolase